MTNNTDVIPTDDVTAQILAEDSRRMSLMFAKFNPITGEGSIGERALLHISDFPFVDQYIPIQMCHIPIVRKLRKCGTVDNFILTEFPYLKDNPGTFAKVREQVIDRFVRIRSLYDFPFWAAMYCYIKRKGGGDDCLFRLTFPQRRFVERLEALRLDDKPIRLVLLKARQWGGSTTSQLYMAWLQLIHRVGLNSLIIAHQGTASDEIKDMFDRMIRRYPVAMLHRPGESYTAHEPKLTGVGHSGAIFRVPQRNCKIKIGTAERPDSCRGGDYNLVHLSEVGLWKATEGKRPEDIVRSACSGVLYKPYTMIVYESTANGVGNFFHREYVDARDNPRSQFRAMFVPWFHIEQNMLPLDSPAEFARWLYDNRTSADAPSNREESGQYLWWLWQQGATLQGINWYITERAKHTAHGSMAAECPSDDTEAFVNSGSAVFDKYHVEELARSCRPPRLVGEVSAHADQGSDALTDLHFSQDSQGLLSVWSLPDAPDDDEVITDRYLTVVDVGGRTSHADWSVIVVFDRLFMLDGGKPSVVAQWYGHCDIDILAWKAAQIAAFYDNSLLVIESNTIETHDRERHIEGGDQSQFILNQIKDVYTNLYARKRSEEDIRQGRPTKYGFHTNIATKPMIISTLIKAVRDGLYTERDRRCLDEMIFYERKPSGAYGAIAGEHDDLLMTRAIGLHICFYDMNPPAIRKRTAAKTTHTPTSRSLAAF